MKKKFLSVVAISALVGLGAVAVTSCNEDTQVEVTKYKVTWTSGGGYTISGLAADGYEAGATVTFTVTADEGKKIDSVKVGDETLTANASGQYSFEIGNADVTIVVSVSNETVTPPEPVEVEITLDKTEVSLDQIGKTETLTAAVTGFEGVVSWATTDATKISITPSEDGLSCTVTNVGGGTAVITATAGSKNAIATVTGSTYTGDIREAYTIYNSDGTVLQDDVKGFWNAIRVLNAAETGANGYITAKDAEEVLYLRDNHWLKGITKDGHKSTETGSLQHFVDGDVAAWVSGYPTHQVDELKETNILIGQKESGTYSYFQQRATNWFIDDPLPDGFFGFSGSAGQTGVISGNQWSGWQTSEYLGAITGAEYVSWSDAADWDGLNLVWDLSDSTLTPSYNDEKGVFAQLYIGSTQTMKKFCGMYFDGGTMAEGLELEDGTTRDIYTFSEDFSNDGGRVTGVLGNRTIGETKIGTAVWDAFNKVWTFPDVKIELDVDMYYSDSATPAENGNYQRIYTISGYNGEEKINEVTYAFDYGSPVARAATQERTVWGCTFTPEYGVNEVADITCGAKWSNVLQESGTRYGANGQVFSSNVQFMAGRVANGGCQTALFGGDCMSGEYTADGKSLFNFYY